MNKEDFEASWKKIVGQKKIVMKDGTRIYADEYKIDGMFVLWRIDFGRAQHYIPNGHGYIHLAEIEKVEGASVTSLSIEVGASAGTP